MDNELSRVIRDMEARLRQLEQRIAALEAALADKAALDILKAAGFNV